MNSRHVKRIACPQANGPTGSLFRARNGKTALAGAPVLPGATHVRALPAEAVRKGDVQEPMRERPGSAVGFAGGLDFHTEGAQAALIAWMSGCTPRMAIIRFRL